MASIAQLRKDKKRAYSKNNLKEVANISNLLGTELQDIGEYDLALKEHQEEASIFEALEDLIGVAVAHRRMGEVYCELKNWDEALKHQNKHLSLAKQLENMVEQQRAYATIGRTYMQLAEEVPIDEDRAKHIKALQDSQNAFFKSLAVCDNIKREVDSNELAQMRARIYHNIGLVLDLKDDPSGALKFVSQALELCTSYNLTEDAYRAYSELSRIHLKLESTAKAMEEANLALKFAKKLQNKRFVIDVYLLISLIHIHNDDFLAARKSLYKAYKINHPSKAIKESVEKNLKHIIRLCNYHDEISKLETDTDSRLKSLDKIGDILCHFGLFKKSIVFYQKMMDLALENNKETSFFAPIYSSLAQSYKDSKQLDKAMEYFQKELDIHLNNNPKETVITLIEMAKVSEMMSQSTDQTRDFYERGFKIATEADSRQLKIIALGNYVVSSCISSKKRELLEAELNDLNSINGSDVECEGSSEDEDEVDLDLIEFSDSDEEQTKMPRVSRSSSGFRLKLNALGETPLHQAVIKGNVSMVKRLIEQNHPVNVRDNSGWLPIHEACNWGHCKIAEILIEAGAWINDRGGRDCSGTTPLHDAATNGHFDIIDLLVESGASIVTKDDKGNTPLDCLLRFAKQNDSDTYELEQCQRIQALLIERMERAAYKVPDRLREPLTRNKTNRNPLRVRHRHEISSSLGEQEEEESFNFNSVLDDKFVSSASHRIRPSPIKSNATETYKTAIKSLGSHSKKLEASHSVSYSSSSKENSTPLIPEEDYVNDDWLIDDIVESETKKRKRADRSEFEYKEESRKRVSPVDVQAISKRKVKQSKLTNLVKRNSFHLRENDDDAENPHFSGGSDVEEVITVEGVDKTLNGNPFYIPSLSQRVFRNSSETSQFTSSSSSSSPPPLRLHVKVLSKKMLVPVAASAQKNTIQWLQEEVSRRYFQLAGVKLSLKLSTIQDEVLNPDDPIDLTLSAGNSELQATVAGIQDLPPLPERYAQTCQSLNLIPLADISSQLRDCDSSGELNLNRNFLRNEKNLAAILSSLHHQNIQTLNLSSCRIQDGGMLNLIQCMSSLSLLERIDVEACSLSSESLQALCGFINNGELSLKKLSYLNLSYNDFADSNFSHLKSLLSFPYLRVLKLKCCGIRLTSPGPSINTPDCSNLQFLDFSENYLTLAAFYSLVSACPHLTHLSVQGSISKSMAINLPNRPSTSAIESLKEPSLGTSLSTLLGVGSECPLEHLDISSCDVKNQDVDILSSYFYRCPSISCLNLSRNPHITSASLAKLVQEVNKTSNLSLKKFYLHGIEALANDSIFNDYILRTLEKRASLHQPFVSLSLPYSSVTQKVSELWLKLYQERCSVKTVSNAIFLTAECST